MCRPAPPEPVKEAGQFACVDRTMFKSITFGKAHSYLVADERAGAPVAVVQAE